MGELLPDRVGITRPDDTGKASAKCHTVAGILELIKCFNVYMAVISQKQPGRIPNLLAYETLIIKAHMGMLGWDMIDGFASVLLQTTPRAGLLLTHSLEFGLFRKSKSNLL